MSKEIINAILAYELLEERIYKGVKERSKNNKFAMTIAENCLEAARERLEERIAQQLADDVLPRPKKQKQDHTEDSS